jgi:isopenicillin N synthase-like dioxygenase
MANETLDPSNQSEGDTKEGIYIGQEIAADSEDAKLPLHGPNQWPREVSFSAQAYTSTSAPILYTLEVLTS